jgi:beta-galactosidase
MGFHPALAQAHRALWELGLVCDVAHPGDDLSRYKAVFAPSRYRLGQNAAANLAGYVTGGGQLLVGPFSAVAGPTNLVYRGGYPGAGLRDVLGIRVSEWHPLPDGATLALSDGSIAELWTEDLQTLDAEVLVTYTEGVLAGQPALTRRTVGQGRAEYLSARLDDASLKVLLRGFLDDADLSPGHLDLSAGVEVLRRHHADGRSWLFVIDHGGAGVTMKAQGFDLISGLPVDGALTLPPGGVAVLREP